jgi:hypothetical protein
MARGTADGQQLQGTGQTSRPPTAATRRTQTAAEQSTEKSQKPANSPPFLQRCGTGHTCSSCKVARYGHQKKIADHCSVHQNDESEISRYWRRATTAFNKAPPIRRHYKASTTFYQSHRNKANVWRLRSRKNQQHDTVTSLRGGGGATHTAGRGACLCKYIFGQTPSNRPLPRNAGSWV